MKAWKWFWEHGWILILPFFLAWRLRWVFFGMASFIAGVHFQDQGGYTLYHIPWALAMGAITTMALSSKER